MNQGSGGRGVARLPNGCESEGGLPLEHDDAGYRQGGGGGTMGDIRLSGGNKRYREAELDGERRRKVAATLAGGGVNSFCRDEGSTATRDILFPPLSHQVRIPSTQPVSLGAGAACESLLRAGIASGRLQHLSMRGQHTSVEDAVQGQYQSQQFQSIRQFLAMPQQQQHQAVAPVPNVSTSTHASRAQILQALSGPSVPQLLQLIRQRQGSSSAVSVTDSNTEQQLLAALASNASTSSQGSQARSLLSGPSTPQLLQLIRQRQRLPSAVSVTESNTEQQLAAPQVPNASTMSQASQGQILSALSGPNILQLLQLIRQQQDLSSVVSVTESNMEQQLSAAPVPNASITSQAGQAQILQAMSGQSISQLLQLIRQRQGLSSAAAAVAESNMQQQLQLPVASTSSPVSQARILQGQSSPSILQLLQHMKSRQGLSSAVSAPESNTQQQLRDLALLASRESAVLSGKADQSSPSNRGDQASARPDASAAPPPSASGIIMWLPVDNDQLSEYQVAVRRQLEVFEAKKEDVESNIQGRKRWVYIGQAGIRCRHCKNLPLRQRGRGAVYFPVKLSGMYQASQNMASSHLSDSCSQIPSDLKKKLRDLRLRRGMASGGKNYWADAGRAIGLYETEDCLRIRPDAVP